MRPWLKAAALSLLLVGSLLPAGGLPVVTIAAAALAPAVAWVVLTSWPVVPRALCLTVVLAAVVAVPAYLTSPIGEYGAGKVHAFLVLTVPTAAAAVLIRNQRDLTVWAKVWVAAGCVIAVFALAGGVDPNGRAVGSDGGSNPIWLARGIGSPAVALLWLLFRRAISLPVGLSAAAVLAAGLYVSGSRGPVVALVIAALVMLIAPTGKPRAGRVTAFAVTTAIALYAALAFQLVPATSRLGAALYDPRGELEASQRIELARPTIDLINASPGGVGFGGWAQHVGIAPYRYPHNLFLEVLAEAGWLAGGVLIAVVVWVMVRLWRGARTNPVGVFVLALIAFETTCVSVSGDLNARTWFFAVALGYSVSYWATAARTTPPESTPTTPAADRVAPSVPTQPTRTGTPTTSTPRSLALPWE